MNKFTKKVADKILELIRSDTYTIVEICRMVNISKATFYNWRKSNAQFDEDVEAARDELREVLVCAAEKSLLKKIQGYTYDETRVVTIPGDKINGVAQPKIKEQITVRKHVPPDIVAIIFTLTNREPETWKNRRITEVTGKDGGDIFKQLSDEELENRISELKDKVSK